MRTHIYAHMGAGVRKLGSKIPRHMPYFSVEFGLQVGILTSQLTTKFTL